MGHTAYTDVLSPPNMSFKGMHVGAIIRPHQ